MCLSKSGETKAALDVYGRLLVLFPGDPVILQRTGCLQMAIGMDLEAEENLSKALAIDPDNEQARACLHRLRRRSPSAAQMH